MEPYELKVRRVDNNRRLPELYWAWYGEPGEDDIREALEAIAKEAKIPVRWELESPVGHIVDGGVFTPEDVRS